MRAFQTNKPKGRLSVLAIQTRSGMYECKTTVDQDRNERIALHAYSDKDKYTLLLSCLLIISVSIGTLQVVQGVRSTLQRGSFSLPSQASPKKEKAGHIPMV